MRMWKRGWTVCLGCVNGFPPAAILALSLTLAGCVQVGPKALFPERGGAAPTEPVALSPAGAAAPRNTCALPELPPLASTVFIAIAPGRPPQADAGGKVLLFGYARAREAIRVCREGR